MRITKYKCIMDKDYNIVDRVKYPPIDVINTNSYEELVSVVQRDNPNSKLHAIWSGGDLLGITYIKDEPLIMYSIHPNII